MGHLRTSGLVQEQADWNQMEGEEKREQMEQHTKENTHFLYAIPDLILTLEFQALSSRNQNRLINKEMNRVLVSCAECVSLRFFFSLRPVSPLIF